jgi:uncharacterized protein
MVKLPLFMHKPNKFDRQLLKNTVEHCKSILSGEGSGHDWWHTYRVWKIAKKISEDESSDTIVVQLAALLHDIEDWKSNGGSHDKTIAHAVDFLREQKLDQNKIEQVCEIISTISFKGANDIIKPATIEAQIVQDADRLEAIGAIGIARVFTYGGSKQREIYNPNIKPQKFKSEKAYLNNKGTSINHFYEKMLLLKDLMNTKTAKKIAARRHRFLLKYLDQFYKEWDGIS